jgi:CysZ protein
MREIAKGLNCFLHGSWLMVARLRLLGWALIPILITAALLIGLIIGFDIWIFGRLGEWFSSDKGWWAAWVRWALFAVAFAGVLVLAYLAFWFVRQMVAAPFNDILSLRTERVWRIEHAQPAESHIRGAVYGENTVRGVGRAITDTTHLTAVEYLAYLICLPFLLVPVAGIIPLWVAHSYYAGLNAFDIALACRGFTLKERKRIFRVHRMRMIGLGIGMALFDLTIILAFFSLPASVVGGTLAILDIDKEGKLLEKVDERDEA